MNRLVTLVLVLVCLATVRSHAFAQSSRVELDHLFIVTKPGALAEIAALHNAGLTVRAEARKHEGQGTASVAVYFENAYLELIWVDSSVSVGPQHARTAQGFRDAAAWRTTGRSPCGLGLHRLAGDTADLPVPVEREAAPWLEPGAYYELLHQPADSLAADFFVVPAIAAVPSWIAQSRARWPEYWQHSGGDRRITLIRLLGAPAHEPAAFRALRPGSIEFVRAREPVLEIHLDGGSRGQRVDLRPVLPLVLIR